MSVARYFFNIYNGTQSRDDVGSECIDAAAVRAEAVETMEELFGGKLSKGRDASSMSINVTDIDGKTVMIVTATASVETVKGSSLTL